MRNDIAVEIQTVNDRPFKGSLTFTEAKDSIFSTCMGLDINLIHGIRFAFSTYPMVKFKLKEQIDVDRNLQHMEYFNFERHYTLNGVEKIDILGCKIRGLRTGNQAAGGQVNETDPDPNVRWVKIEWVDYAIEEKRILDWLDYFGEQAGQLSEDIHPNSDSDADLIGNGTFSIKMRLKRDIPQLLPMWGKRIRIYHRGVQKLCSNCFGVRIQELLPVVLLGGLGDGRPVFLAGRQVLPLVIERRHLVNGGRLRRLRRPLDGVAPVGPVLEDRVAHHLLADRVDQLQAGELQQLDCHLKLRGHHQLLLQPLNELDLHPPTLLCAYPHTEALN